VDVFPVAEEILVGHGEFLGNAINNLDHARAPIQNDIA
jgi:hypothetical protein